MTEPIGGTPPDSDPDDRSETPVATRLSIVSRAADRFEDAVQAVLEQDDLLDEVALRSVEKLLFNQDRALQALRADVRMLRVLVRKRTNPIDVVARLRTAETDTSAAGYCLQALLKLVGGEFVSADELETCELLDPPDADGLRDWLDAMGSRLRGVSRNLHDLAAYADLNDIVGLLHRIGRTP